MIHIICPDINITSEPSVQTNPKPLRFRLSPKARKLIKQCSVIEIGNSINKNIQKNEESSSFLEQDGMDGLNRVSFFPQNFIFQLLNRIFNYILFLKAYFISYTNTQKH